MTPLSGLRVWTVALVLGVGACSEDEGAQADAATDAPAATEVSVAAETADTADTTGATEVATDTTGATEVAVDSEPADADATGTEVANDVATEVGPTDTTVDTETATETSSGPANTIYVSFVLNVHDWVFPAESIATLGRIIDLHEQYQQPVDFYLTDPMLQLYLTQAPALVERMKTSPVVTISHHVRPPAPYYSGFDWAGLNALSEQALATKLLAYEEHALDLATGEPTSAPGGFELMKSTFGYPPYVVTMASGQSAVNKALAKIFIAKGAKFTLTHNEAGTEWGATSNGLLLRPETVEMKVYERKSEIDFESELLAPALAEIGDKRPAFINLKWHEDNFHTSGTPWQNVYYDADGVRRPRPWDPSAIGAQAIKTQAQMDIQWRRYEAALQVITAHPELYTISGIRNFAHLAGLE